MDEFFVVDRVENNIAVLECPDGKFLNVEVDSLPFKVREIGRASCRERVSSPV